MTNTTKEEVWCRGNVGEKKPQQQRCSEGNIKCQFVTSELRRERNMEMKEDLGDSALPPFRPALRVFIRYTSFVLHAGLAVGLDPHGYGNPDFCWLSIHDTLIWSFVGPISVVVLVGSRARVESLLRLWVPSDTAWVKLTRTIFLLGEHCDLHPGREGFLWSQAEGHGEVRSHVSVFFLY